MRRPNRNVLHQRAAVAPNSWNTEAEDWMSELIRVAFKFGLFFTPEHAISVCNISTEYFTETALCIPLAVAAQINKTLAAYVIEDGNVTAAFLLNWIAWRGY